MTRPAGIFKKMNPYAEQLGERLYRDAPKAVLAAIAVSSLTLGGDYLDEAEKRVLSEWWILFDNAIVSQRPPGQRPIEENPS